MFPCYQIFDCHGFPPFCDWMFYFSILYPAQAVPENGGEWLPGRNILKYREIMTNWQVDACVTIFRILWSNVPKLCQDDSTLFQGGICNLECGGLTPLFFSWVGAKCCDPSLLRQGYGGHASLVAWKRGRARALATLRSKPSLRSTSQSRFAT